MWPVGSRTAIEGLMEQLASEGIEEVVVYSDRQAPLDERSFPTQTPVRVRFVRDPEVSGSAGMLRMAVDAGFTGRIVVLPVNVVNPPRVSQLLAAHSEGQGVLTVFLNPGPCETLSEVYVCEGSILEHIPEQGYWDIKERVIPELATLGKRVHQAVLPEAAGWFDDGEGYLQAVSDHLDRVVRSDPGLRPLDRGQGGQVWVSGAVDIHPAARVCGLVAALEGACIGEETVVVGPAVIGRKASVDRGAAVVRSVLWDQARVGSGAQVTRCVVGRDASLPSGDWDGDVVASPRRAKSGAGAAVTGTPRSGRVDMTKGRVGLLSPRVAAGLAAVTAALLWSLWPGLKDLWTIWNRSDEYSSGLLVPLLAAYVLWCRRDEFKDLLPRPCLWGLVLLVLGQGLRIFGLYQLYGSAERLSVVVTIWAVALALGGWGVVRKVWPVLAFLVLMLPWPNRVQTAITLPLQSWSTSSAVFGLELIGYDVVREGNVIHIGDTSVAVAEACNGLRMITAFFVITGLVVLLVRRPWWEKLIVLLSSVPIALICNTLRLAVTAVAFTVLKGDRWQQVFHDFGGYAMMPLALAIVVAELWILRRLTDQPMADEGAGIIRRVQGKDGCAMSRSQAGAAGRCD